MRKATNDDAEFTYLYCIRSSSSPRFYFGISWNPKKRFQEHKAQARRMNEAMLYMAMRKYGIDTFSMSVIAKFKNRNDAAAAEMEMISSYGGIGGRLLWNATTGGDSGYNFTRECSLERGKKISIAARNPEAKKLRSAASKHIWNDPDVRRRHSKSMSIYYSDPEWIARRKEKQLSTMESAANKIKRRGFIAGVSVLDNSDVKVLVGIADGPNHGFDSSGLSKCLRGVASVCKGRVWQKISVAEGLLFRGDLLAQLSDQELRECLSE